MLTVPEGLDQRHGPETEAMPRGRLERATHVRGNTEGQS
jgi:hypothetical protein